MIWAIALPHPQEVSTWPVDDLLREAVRYECENDEKDIDEARENLVKEWVLAADARQQASKDLLQREGFAKCRLRAQLHHSFFEYQSDDVVYLDRALCSDFLFDSYW